MAILTRIAQTFLRSSSLGIGAPCQAILPVTTAEAPSVGIFGQMVRTVIRCHFPRPSERKRIKRHGFKTRMSTPEGRRVLMRRILKGRFIISH